MIFLRLALLLESDVCPTGEKIEFGEYGTEEACKIKYKL